ncbi:hypothetical protein Nepgr_029999 [Nepenthes gracilis]|uniref:Uncharacterized protein n=1 Tax=Nepenthes gracilis TaxID=150966 RepID=A0AAD3Y649_NEPGR|nr:hypothetical protein Nepgr_029999 [Nepenthes gracilis]
MSVYCSQYLTMDFVKEPMVYFVRNAADNMNSSSSSIALRIVESANPSPRHPALISISKPPRHGWMETLSDLPSSS